MPPFFVKGIEYQEYKLDFNTKAIKKLFRTGDYIFIYLNLPTILDYNLDFCSIYYDSETFGSGYWTNNTDSSAILDLKQLFWKSKGEIVEDSFLSYDDSTN